jgi:hypothetical protein
MKGDKIQDDRSFDSSDMRVGVECGISSYEKLSRGATNPNETTAGDGTGSTSRQKTAEVAAGSKGGKNFVFKY